MKKSVKYLLGISIFLLIMPATLSVAVDRPSGPDPLKENNLELNFPDGGANKDYYIGDWCNAAYYWPFPNSLGRNHFAQRFDIPTVDTLMEIGLLLYHTGGNWGYPDLRVTVWGDMAGVPDSSYPIYSTVIYNDYIIFYPTFTTHTVPGLVVVPPTFHVSVTLDGALPGDTLSIVSDDGTCGDHRSTYSPDGVNWYYVADLWLDDDVNFVIYVRLAKIYGGPVWYVSPGGNDSYDGTRMDPFATIQHAVDVASTGDTIVLLPGTYTGVGNRHVDLGFKNLVIKSDQGADVTTIDVQSSGSDGFRLMTLQDTTTVIEGIKIINAHQALYLQETTPIMRNMILEYNEYGVYSFTTFGSPPRLENSTLLNNTSGVYSDGMGYTSFYIDSCIFTGNQMAAEGDFYIKNSTIQNGVNGLATNGEGPAGYQFQADNCYFTGNTGRVLEVGFMSTLNYCRIQNNDADYIAFGESFGTTYLIPIFNNCEIDNNSGGMYLVGYDVYLTMNNSRYANNGDKIYFLCGYRGEVSIDNSIFISNDSVPLAIVAGESGVTITNSSFLENLGDGLRLANSMGGAIISSCTFANNLNGIHIYADQDYLNFSYNIIGFNYWGFYSEVPIDVYLIGCNDVYGNIVNYYGSIPDQTGINENISLNPQFCDTSVHNYQLNETSPCAPENNGCGVLMGAYDVGCYVLRPLIVRAVSSTGPKSGCPSVINIKVTDPYGYYIGMDAYDVLTQTLFPATYYEDKPPDCADEVYIDYPVPGEYVVEVIAEDGAPTGATYAMGIQIDGSVLCVQVEDADVPTAGGTDTYTYTVEEGYHYLNGDANRDNVINILDITFIISFLYKGGPEPYPYGAGDANCNLIVNILDITYLINNLYKGGPPPCDLSE